MLRKEGLLVDFSNLSVDGAPPDQCSSRIPPWGELNSDLLNAIAFANPDTLCDFYPASKTTKALLTSRFREWNGTTGAKVENKYIKALLLKSYGAFCAMNKRLGQLMLQESAVWKYTSELEQNPKTLFDFYVLVAERLCGEQPKLSMCVPPLPFTRIYIHSLNEDEMQYLKKAMGGGLLPHLTEIRCFGTPFMDSDSTNPFPSSDSKTAEFLLTRLEITNSNNEIGGLLLQRRKGPILLHEHLKKNPVLQTLQHLEFRGILNLNVDTINDILKALLDDECKIELHTLIILTRGYNTWSIDRELIRASRPILHTLNLLFKQGKFKKIEKLKFYQHDQHLPYNPGNVLEGVAKEMVSDNIKINDEAYTHTGRGFAQIMEE